MSRTRVEHAPAVAVCVVMIVVPLSLEGLDFRSFGGYPAIGFAVALLVLVGRRRLPWALLGETVLAGAALTRTYDVSPVVGLVASLSLTVPAVIVWGMLTAGGRLRFEIESLAGEQRFFAATALGATVCAVLGGTVSLTEVDVQDAMVTALMAFLSALAAQLAVLPVLVRGSRSAQGGRVEGVVQWLVLLVVFAAVFVPRSALPLAFLLPAVLAWGANRGSPRTSHLQLLVTSVVAYLFTFTGRGPLVDLPVAEPTVVGPILLYLLLCACAYAAIPVSASISRLQRVTLEATASASMMERVLESAAQTFIITTDRYGAITRVNRGAEAILGWSSSELVGQSPALFHAPEEIARHARRLGLADDDYAGVSLAMVESGERWEWRSTTRDGRELVINLGLSPISDDDGTIVGYVGVADDMTERHAATEAMRTALENEHASVTRLREVDRVKQELVSNVSHELRTPITSISGYAEMLADGAHGALTPQQLEVVARIDRNSQRLIRLVEDLLTLSRLESGALELHRTPTDVGAVVREVGVVFDSHLRTRDLDVRIDLPSSPVVMDVDAHELERVLVNLVGNAIKFTPDGGRVEVSVRGERDAAYITVSDTGLGIAADEQEQLFGRFFRASTAIDHSIQGTGLGLSIAHAIVVAHGGTIEVDSELGRGTTMVIRLPRCDVVADEPLFDD